MPTDRVYDGRDMSDVLLKLNAPSPHTVLWLYNQDPHMATDGGPSAGRGTLEGTLGDRAVPRRLLSTRV